MKQTQSSTISAISNTGISSKISASSLGDNGLHYLLIINKQNQPLFFKAYQQSIDDLNIQLHCFASLDFLDEKWIEKTNEYLGSVYTIYNLSGNLLILLFSGEYSIYAFYTVTKIKILAIFKQKQGQKYDDTKVKNFFMKAYKVYKKQLYQPFQNTLDQNKFSKKFHYQLDLIASTHAFK